MLNKFKVKKDIDIFDSNNNFTTAVPPGVIVMHTSSEIPEGWLLCDGSSYEKLNYPNLDAVLSVNSYPFGSTSTTFSVPDMVQKMPIASGSGAGLTVRTLGEIGGSNDRTLVEDNTPPHQHGLNNHTHPSDTMNNAGSHAHTMNTGGTNTGSANHSHGFLAHTHPWSQSAIRNGGTATFTIRASGQTRTVGIIEGNNATTGTYIPFVGTFDHSHGIPSGGTGNQSANHTHNLTTGGNTGFTTDGTLTPTTFNVENPYITMVFLIKY
jgi:microcystin-dependent protein